MGLPAAQGVEILDSLAENDQLRVDTARMHTSFSCDSFRAAM
jgi:hypothetical protein